ncbi:MAG: NYN domain-containing protein, partial [Actinomycetia bacterium]|nr:NYN domain-containing protein [Actinomycetes bacterium]
LTRRTHRPPRIRPGGCSVDVLSDYQVVGEADPAPQARLRGTSRSVGRTGQPDPMRTNVYVDGFNLYYGCLKGTAHRWLDLEALCRKLLPPQRHTVQVLHRAGQRTSRPAARSCSPRDLPAGTEHSADRLDPPRALLDAHDSDAARPPDRGRANDGRGRETEEKGSDVNLATYLLADAFRKDADAFVIISNDSDLTAPLRIVRHELGMVVGLVNPRKPAKRSQALQNCQPTFFKQIRATALATSQLPPSIVDATGKITRPAGW